MGTSRNRAEGDTHALGRQSVNHFARNGELSAIGCDSQANFFP